MYMYHHKTTTERIWSKNYGIGVPCSRPRPHGRDNHWREKVKVEGRRSCEIDQFDSTLRDQLITLRTS